MNSIRSKLKNTKTISSKSKLLVEAEKRHIQAHLALTELRLRLSKHKNNADRQTALNVLHGYWKKAIFPVNTYKIYERTPVFIDDKGTYCAVGHLMAETGYGVLANKIDRENKFVLVEELHCSDAEAWLDKHGLSKQEAALIQPGYGGFIIERVGYTVQDKIMAVLALTASLLLVAFVIIALRLRNSVANVRPKTRVRYLQLAAASALIISSFVFYLPAPTQAVNAIAGRAIIGKETITCDGENAFNNRRTSICNEFKEKGSVPGWREVPCDLCLL